MRYIGAVTLSTWLMGDLLHIRSRVGGSAATHLYGSPPSHQAQSGMSVTPHMLGKGQSQSPPQLFLWFRFPTLDSSDRKKEERLVIPGKQNVAGFT